MCVFVVKVVSFDRVCASVSSRRLRPSATAGREHRLFPQEAPGDGLHHLRQRELARGTHDALHARQDRVRSQPAARSIILMTDDFNFLLFLMDPVFTSVYLCFYFLFSPLRLSHQSVRPGDAEEEHRRGGGGLPGHAHHRVPRSLLHLRRPHQGRARQGNGSASQSLFFFFFFYYCLPHTRTPPPNRWS